MQRMITLLLLLAAFTHAAAQDCNNLMADLKKGTLAGLTPKATQEQVKQKLPCFTGDTEDGSDFNCGGGVFFLDHDCFFYTHHNYIEMRAEFRGKLSVAVLGLTRAAALKMKGLGKVVRTIESEGSTQLFFARAYGCIRLVIKDNRVVIVAMHSQPAAAVKLCE